MNLYKKFGTDKNLEENGVWIDFGEGVKVKVARKGNKAYADYLIKLTKQHRSAIRTGTLASDKVEEISLRAMTRLLVDWEGVTDEAGNLLPYSEANVVKILRDLPEFRRLIDEIADDQAAFRKEEDEDSEKN